MLTVDEYMKLLKVIASSFHSLQPAADRLRQCAISSEASDRLLWPSWRATRCSNLATSSALSSSHLMVRSIACGFVQFCTCADDADYNSGIRVRTTEPMARSQKMVPCEHISCDVYIL